MVKRAPVICSIRLYTISRPGDVVTSMSGQTIEILNTDPICSFTWILLYERQVDADKGRKLADFIRWALVSGGAHAEALDYAPLPPTLATRVANAVDRLTFGPSR